MRLKIATTVNMNFHDVFRGFDRILEEKLQPPIIPVKLKRFDGYNWNDEHHLDIDLLVYNPCLVSAVTFIYVDENEMIFVHEGKTLPFLFRKWKHIKRLVRINDTCTIIGDEIRFETFFPLMNWILYPLMYLLMLYRIPVYSKTFSTVNKFKHQPA